MYIYISYLLINISYGCLWLFNFSCNRIRRFKVSIFINLTYWIVSLLYSLICLPSFSIVSGLSPSSVVLYGVSYGDFGVSCFGSLSLLPLSSTYVISTSPFSLRKLIVYISRPIWWSWNRIVV